MKTKTVSAHKPSTKREPGQHHFTAHGLCVTCGADEDDAYVGGQECTYKPAPQTNAVLLLQSLLPVLWERVGKSPEATDQYEEACKIVSFAKKPAPPQPVQASTRELLEIAKLAAHVIETTNPESVHYLDSGADSIQLLLARQADIESAISKAEGAR